MDEIIKYVNIENREWVSNLTPEKLAQILNTLSMIPNMKLKSVDSLSEIPSNVGKTGELILENIISKFMPIDYILEDTSKHGYKGDFIIKWQSHKTNKLYKIIIDVKNYKVTVPQKEIDKFYRDIKLNSDIHGGILLSLNAKIVSMSKIIEFKDLNTDRGILPITFIKSNQPESICEIIKLLFHTIELKDLNSNDILYKQELISAINELSDQIQHITDCRNNLQNSKSDIEKSLNCIMFSLMQCEYNITTKIKQINKSLVNQNQICIYENKQIDEPIKISMIDTVINLFKTSIELNYDSLLHSIYNLLWDNTNIDFEKKQWNLYNKDFCMIIKFNKKSMNAIFNLQTDNFINIINEESINKLILKSDGYHIIINPENINFIIKLCNSYKTN
jgi:hypothetical protein